MTDRLIAPWDDATVASLNRWQAAGYVHPFTCRNDRSDAAHRAYAAFHHQGDFGILIATRIGWVCPACGYHQGWAHAHMVIKPIDPATFLGIGRST
jgi:hypothetical protein